jgi:hypothetical protein
MNSLLHASNSKTGVLVVWVLLVFLLWGCKDLGEQLLTPVQTITATVKNTETYEYQTASGDEEGARITQQAKHYTVSEIRRNASTNFVCVYVYQPRAGYVGSDYVELQAQTNAQGVSGGTSTSTVRFKFTVTN